MLLFKQASLKPVELDTLLVPLERVEALGQLRPKATLDVVVNSKVSLNHISEILDDFIGVLVEKSLKLGHFFVIVEIFLVFGVQLDKNRLEVLEGLNKLLSTPLLGQIGRLLQLVVLLHQAIVESWQFALHIVLDVSLLIAHNLENFGFEFLLALHLEFFELVEHGIHQRSEDTHVLGRHLLALLDIVLDIAELLLKVVKTLDRASDFLFFTLELLHGPMLEPKQLHIAHGLLGVAHFFEFCLLVHELLLNALLAQRLLVEHHDRLGEVLLTQIHLHRIREEGLHGGLAATSATHGLHIRVSGDALTRPTIEVLVCRFFGLVDHLLTVRVGASSPLAESWEIS